MAKSRSSKPKGRARERGDSVPVTSEFDPTLLRALDSFVATHKPRTSRRACIEWAVEEFLTRRNAWPPK